MVRGEEYERGKRAVAGEVRVRACGDASGADEERVGTADGAMDAARAWRCGAVISCVWWRWCGGSTGGVAALGDERSARYSSRELYLANQQRYGRSDTGFEVSSSGAA